ncbi:MAG: polyprenyl synthetase family protein [Planctomycetota bacterium]
MAHPPQTLPLARSPGNRRAAPLPPELDAETLGVLAGLEADLVRCLQDEARDLASAAGRHLLGAPGKRVRPLLCVLATRVAAPGAALPVAVRPLALAAELVHAATLLHDDVIDFADSRRGHATARLLHGNAASVLGGDLLLVRALECIQGVGVPELLPAMLRTLRRMVHAEALQLELRGRTDAAATDYFRVCRGKTAALFDWVAEAGGRAAGAPAGVLRDLRRFARHVGVAFQLVDDLLDLTSDPTTAGKSVLQDVRQGTVTFPVLVALRDDAPLAQRVIAAAAGGVDQNLGVDVVAAAHRRGGIAMTRRHVQHHTARARLALATLPSCDAGAVLDQVARQLEARVA